MFLFVCQDPNDTKSVSYLCKRFQPCVRSSAGKLLFYCLYVCLFFVGAEFYLIGIVFCFFKLSLLSYIISYYNFIFILSYYNFIIIYIYISYILLLLYIILLLYYLIIILNYHYYLISDLGVLLRLVSIMVPGLNAFFLFYTPIFLNMSARTW